MSADRGYWPWDELDLNGPVPEAEVRRAYARRLKLLDVERQPDAFEALRAAYSAARQIARDRARMAAEGHDDEDGPPAALEAAAFELPEPRPHAPEDAPACAAAQMQDAAAPERDPAPDPHWHDWNQPPHHMPPRDAAPDQPTGLTYAQAVAQLHLLLTLPDVKIGDWHALLNEPVLDAPETSQRFEEALLEALRSPLPLDGPSVYRQGFSDPDWLELMEARYGWKSDGLRFQSRFPTHLPIRARFVSARELTGLDGGREALQRQLARPRKRRWYTSPIFVAILALFVISGPPGAMAHSDLGERLGLTFFMTIVIWLCLPRRLKQRQATGNWTYGLGRFGDWLRQRDILRLGLNTAIVATSALYLALVLPGNYRAGWIPASDVTPVWAIATAPPPKTVAN